MQKKARRLQEGRPPRVLDLFSGCGGISLGFQAAGFHIDANVEVDPDAAATHAFNFHQGHPRYAQARDITQILPDDLAAELGLTDGGLPLEQTIDVIVGGPPCQAYARIGRPKLREIQQHPEAFLHDERASLFELYLAYVAAFRPLALLMENVPDIMNQGGQNVAQVIAGALEDSGYTVGYTLLNAAFYGVPQMRERMFLVAYRQELGLTVTFPDCTHYIQLPRGYEGIRQVALKSLSRPDLTGEASSHHYVQPPVPSPELPPAVTAQDALQDLPVIRDHLDGKPRRESRRFEDTEPLPYRTPARDGSYAHLMRQWAGFGERGGVRDHAVRYLPRDHPIFERMKPGDQYPEAKQIAVRIFLEKLREAARQGKDTTTGSVTWELLLDATVPPYDDSKFANRWRKMEPDRPARTLMAHLGKDGYSHIHYDSAQARTISVREAARLQGFPDGFVFRGTMNPAFRQIGNAAPPLLVRAIAAHMLTALQTSAAHLLDRTRDLETQPA